MLRLHIGAGDVYLKDYINIDVYIEGYTYLAHNISEEDLKKNLSYFTSFNGKSYYPNPKTKEELFNKNNPYEVPKFESQKCIVDMYCDIRLLSQYFKEESVDEIVCVHVLEHLPNKTWIKAIDEMYKVLKSDRELLIAVPDVIENCKQLLKCKNDEEREWLYRLTYGSQKNKYSLHCDGFTYTKLQRFLLKSGFKTVKKLNNLFGCSIPTITVAVIK